MTPSPLRPKIIVIDDDRPILMTLEALLNRRGFDPQLARHGARASTNGMIARRLQRKPGECE